MPVTVKTADPLINSFYSIVQSFLNNDVSEYEIDGEHIRGYRSPDCNAIWLRDHVHQMKAFKYFENDMKSAVTHFYDYQAQNGRLFDYVKTGDKEDWLEYIRVPAESDIEYLGVVGAFTIWQATGDDKWIRNLLPKLEKGLKYSMTSPWRWSEEFQLIKRPWTIDTWDFHYIKDSKWLNFNIDNNTHMCIFYGDNSGFYDACRKIGSLYRYFAEENRAEHWYSIGESIKKRTNELCWNGSFYTHMIHLDDEWIPGLDEKSQLSLSNPYTINRGLPDHKMAVSILEEYRKRKISTNAFAEWFSIDPPFPEGTFSDPLLKPGVYCNGGIMPLVGGELAKAAFDHGYERYGAEILKQYMKMVSESNETYLWYFPDGSKSTKETSTSPDALPTDGWGSSAMLYAFLEGLCGVTDEGKCFDPLRISPRWAAAGIEKAEVEVSYADGKDYCKYRYSADTENNEIILKIESTAKKITAGILIPEGRSFTSASVNGKPEKGILRSVESSRYIDLTFVNSGSSTVKLSLR